MKPLTYRQAQILNFIKQHISDEGVPPTRAEISKQIGAKSANAAEEHLRAIAKKGYIEIMKGAARGIRITDSCKDMMDLGMPLIGRVAAGEPILAIEHVEGYYNVDPTIFHPVADYLLRVCGDSMKNIGMLDGDLLAVHRTEQVRNGQVVVVRVDGNVTVKRFERMGDSALLHAENEDYLPIEVNLFTQEVVIEGLAVGVIRNRGW